MPKVQLSIRLAMQSTTRGYQPGHLTIISHSSPRSAPTKIVIIPAFANRIFLSVSHSQTDFFEKIFPDLINTS